MDVHSYTLLQRVPKVNSVWQGDNAQMTSAVDICVAVATDQGLITPIVKNPAFLPFEEISSAVKVCSFVCFILVIIQDF